MAYQNNPGQGVMFPNDQQGNPNRPMWRGTVNIGGKEYEISAWDRVSQRGNRFLSLEVREPWQGQNQSAPQNGGYAPRQQAPQQQQYGNQGYQQNAPRQQAPRPAPQPQPQPQYAPQPSAPAQGGQEPSDLPFR